MKPLSRNSIFTLLFFFLFSSYVGATHIHHDPFVAHSDCKVCVVAKSLHSDDITPHFSPLPPMVYHFEAFSMEEEVLSYLPNKGFNAHAPPA